MTWLHDFLANQATAQSAGNGEVYPPIRTGPQSAIRATSPASPYARDRVQAPSNRPAPRTPTLRSRAQDVIRSAPGALTAARERQVYDTTWSDVGRGAQELTGLPSLARGAGGLTAMAQLGMRGELGSEHIAPGAMAAGETALGLLGPMSLPRSAARTARATPLPQQYSSADTFESGPFSALYFNASPSRINLLEMGTDSAARGQGHARRGMQEFLRSHGNRDIYLTPSPTEPPYDVARLEGFYRSLGFGPVPGDADTFAWRRLGQPTTAQRIPRIAREIGPNGMPVAQSQPTRNSFRGGSSDLREAAGMRTPPPTTPTGTAPFGDPRAYPPQAWEEFGSLQGGAPEARASGAGGNAAAPSTSELNRMVADARRARPDAAAEDLGAIRWVQDANGNYHVGHALDVDHFALLERLKRDGIEIPGQTKENRHLRGHFFRDEAGQWRSTDMNGTDGPLPTRGRSPGASNRPQPLLGGTPEARLRAQEQGFDTGRVLYHGTDKDFPAFDVGQAGTGANAGLREEAVFLTDSPAVADSYLSGGYVRSENARGASADMGDGVARWYGDGAQVMPVHVRNGGDMDYWDWGGGGYSPEQIERALREAREAGRPGVVFRGIRDPGIQNTVGPVGNPRRPSNMVAVFDPSNIRSIFAAFDPAKRDSSDLLAASAAATPIPIAAHALTQQQNTTGRPRGRPGFFGGR